MNRTFFAHLVPFSLFALSLVIHSSGYAATRNGPNIPLMKGQTLRGHFVHDHPFQGFDEPMRTEGRFLVSPDSQITWIIEKPMLTTTVLTKEGLTQSMGKFTLLRLTPRQMPLLGELQRNLILALRGDWGKLKRDYDVVQNNSGLKWKVTITPKKKSNATKVFERLEAEGAEYVETVDILLSNGKIDHVVFSDSTIDPR